MGKMRVICGKHADHIIEVVGWLWASGIIVGKLEDGTEYGFRFWELEPIK